MMSVQRTDIGCKDSFEEQGGTEEDFASSEKLVVEIDQEYKGILERTRGVLLAKKLDKLHEVVAKGNAGEWFDETGSLSAENQLKGAIRKLLRQVLDIDVKNPWNWPRASMSENIRGRGSRKTRIPTLTRASRLSKPSWGMRRSSRKSSSATARQNGTSADSRERVCDCG